MARTEHLRALTGLRFIAAFHVVVFHLAPREIVPRALVPLVDTGYVGVSLFFVLSGFILAHTYTRSGPLDGPGRRRFWQARFARVYPVYAVGLIVAMPMLLVWATSKFAVEPGPLATAKVGITIVANVLLLQAWITATIGQWNSPGWTLSCEAVFYSLFPTAARRLSNLTPGDLRLMILVMAGAALLAPAAYLIASPDGLANVTHESSGKWLSVLKYNPLVRLPEFLLGIALGRLFVLAAPARGGSWLVAMGGASASALLLLSESIPYVLLHNGLLALPFALVIYGLARGGGVAGKLLASVAGVLLGEASYALYILHSALGRWAPVLGIADPFLRFVAMVIIVVAVSLIVNRFIEEPLRKRLRSTPREEMLSEVPRPAH